MAMAALVAIAAWAGRDGNRPALAKETPAKASAESASATANGPLIGDASLKGQLDLNKMSLVGGEYRVPLPKGGNAVLTLDPAIQKSAEKTLERAQAPLGAIVVTDMKGRIVALAGRRNLEPAREKDFSLALDVWAPAASVFKIVTSAALVSKGVNPKGKVCYHGGLRAVEKSHLTDDPKRDTACADLSTGVAKSQNAIIAKLANRHLNTASLRDFARRFGFDKSVNFALSCTASRCQIPDEAYERAKVSAGFWKSELSPLGGAMLTNVIASGGKSLTPRIVDRIERGGKVTQVVSAPGERVIKERVAKQVGLMMERAVQPGGTAYKGFYNRRGEYMLGDNRVAGKTGSLSVTEPTYLAYSWFVGYAPTDKPKYIISVALGNPMKWHVKAHTAARLVLQEALRSQPVAASEPAKKPAKKSVEKPAKKPNRKQHRKKNR